MKHRLAMLALVATAGCEQLRDRPGEAQCVTWEGEVRSHLVQRCSTCHAGDFATYQQTIRTAAAGDARSSLLVNLHPDQAESLPLLTRWVVDCRLALRDSLVHAPGLQNPADPEFHGALLRSLDYDFPLCADCHGARFNGGGAKSSCLGCHQQGPTDCSTCHSKPDREHQAHASVDCARCHQVPERWDAAGHLDPPPAEVRFLEAGAFDPAEKRCSGVDCHGGALDDVAAANPAPTWRAGDGQTACGSCHGAPPASHQSDRCDACHPVSVHVDGAVQLGRSEEGCRGCHGTPEAPAPEDRGHRVHLAPELGLRGPIACSDCHLVPEAIRSPGHIDSALPAEVFPAEIAAVSLAFARGARPAFEQGTCAGTYCHGDVTPEWTRGTTACGSCHGIPPRDAAHDPGIGIGDCATCHGSAVDPFGNPRSEHLDGNVDF